MVMSFESSLKPNLPITGLEFNAGIEKLRQSIDTRKQGSEADRLNQLKKASQDFESIFVGYMLKVMRSTVEVDGDEPKAFGKDIYMDMFDNEIASNIVKARSLGIGDLLYRQFSERMKEDGTGAGPSVEQKQFPLQTPSAPVIPLPSGSRNTASPSLEEQQETDPERGLSTPLQGELTSAFGYRPDPETHQWSFHHGLDIAAPIGTPFQAAQSGTVIYSGMLGSFGNTIVIEHEGGYRSLYAHASRVLVSPGDTVTAEQTIGIVGNTGHSRGVHLHFELQKGGERVNPAEFLTPQQNPYSLNSGLRPNGLPPL